MSTTNSDLEFTLNLFSRWTNAQGDLYIYVSNVTETTVDILLSDSEGENLQTYTIGDLLHLNDGAWVLVETHVDAQIERPHAWQKSDQPNAVFRKFAFI